jgi:predicted RNase H-like nuclease (RuvC/YqgF family)
LPALVDSSSSDDDGAMPTYECEATGYKATERHWKKIRAHNRKWERKFKVLKAEHENTMHGPVITGQELAVVIDCFKQSKEAERLKYVSEKARNDDMKEGLKKFEKNLDLLLMQAERREGMLAEKDKIIDKLRKEAEKKTNQVSSLKKYIQVKESRISSLESALEKGWAKNTGIKSSR